MPNTIHARATQGLKLSPSSSDEGSAKQLRGIVLAGSYDRGDGPVSRFLRRPLIPLAQTPMICYPLHWLRDAGIRRATICGSTATPDLRGFLASGAGLQMQLDYYVEGHPRGPAGCARDAALQSDGETFIVVEGSMIPFLDVGALLAAHRLSGALATTVVEIDRRQSRASTKLRLPGGVYVFAREVLAHIPPTGFQDIKQGLLERLHASRVPVHTHEVLGVSPRVLDYASYTSASRWVIGSAEKRAEFLKDFIPVGEGMHHPTAHVSPSARLIGPVLLGAGVRVEPHAVIVGPTTIGEGSVVERMALVARSVVLSECIVRASASVDSSLLADGVEIESGADVMDSVQLKSTVFAPRKTGMEQAASTARATETVERPIAGSLVTGRSR